MIKYTTELENIQPESLQGFFVDWPNPPSPVTHLKLLNGSSHKILAIDSESGEVVGFITAISDGVLSAYIPLLEVLPAYKNNGIGKELVQRMIEELKNLYMVDLLCDDHLQPYYEKQGMMKASGMIIRNYQHQAGILE
ncbi:GNAT family N-acetyltransferase [Psychrobacillus sp. NPDC058041]|uniref:GNAT family N-acetyltransferase n=1 Tax=Psychrobacillus sp. NPDC058041 TaxID=3346310 RepID=UPI0036DA4634